MYELHQFSQNALLVNETDPVVKGGVCVALCRFWFEAVLKIKDNPSLVPPDQRLRELGLGINSVIAEQRKYTMDRRVLPRSDAQQELGGRADLDYEPQTTISGGKVGPGEIINILARDLTRPGKAATWSLRFKEGGGHAIAGFSGLVSITDNIHRTKIHIFDPNIGEFTGESGDFNQILNNIFNHYKDYTIVEIHRTQVQTF